MHPNEERLPLACLPDAIAGLPQLNRVEAASCKQALPPLKSSLFSAATVAFTNIPLFTRHSVFYPLTYFGAHIVASLHSHVD